VSLLPHWARPVVVVWLVSAWSVLEIGYRAALGDPSWLDVPSPVRLEPQARQAVLTLMFRQRAVAEAGPVQWVVPVWRFIEFPSPDRPRDRLDLTMMLPPGCVQSPIDEPMPRLRRIANETARRVWIARHWDEERIVDRWASCIANQLENCGERVPSVLDVREAVHLWAHDTARGACKERWVGAGETRRCRCCGSRRQRSARSSSRNCRPRPIHTLRKRLPEGSAPAIRCAGLVRTPPGGRPCLREALPSERTGAS
jgi:hypothetical protein